MQQVYYYQKLLLELTRRRVDIDTIIRELNNRGVFDDEDKSEVILEHRKRIVRRELKQIKDAEGFPLIFSLVELDSDGRVVRKYKQESLFSIEDYKQAIEYCRQHKRYWSKIERRLLKNAKTRFNGQTELFG